MGAIRGRRYPQAFVGLGICLVLILVVSLGTNPDSTDSHVEAASGFSMQAGQNVSNPELPEAVCDNLQVVVLLDRSGSVTEQGAATVQKYRDQVKKVWHTLHQVSLTYDGYTSGTLWAFAGRTANQMELLANRDNNNDGVIDEQDLNLANRRVLNRFDDMTQDIYFSYSASPEHPSNQPFTMGYNPQKESRLLFHRIQYTNWHEALLMAQDTVKSTNADANKANHSLVIMITDGVPTVNDGPNHRWDTFKLLSRTDEEHDGNQNNPNHAIRAREVINSLRSGRNVSNSNDRFDPVQVYGILIGGGSFGANKMETAFGSGSWFQSQDFDSTIGTHILNVVANACPPAATLVPELHGELLNPVSTAIEGDRIHYTIDLTNTGTAGLENVKVANGSVVEILDNEDYSNSGILAAGQKRRFVVVHEVGAASPVEHLTFNYSADVSDDSSLLLPGSPTSLSGHLSTTLNITLIPRPI